jgi:hypothetical protein
MACRNILWCAKESLFFCFNALKQVKMPLQYALRGAMIQHTRIALPPSFLTVPTPIGEVSFTSSKTDV